MLMFVPGPQASLETRLDPYPLGTLVLFSLCPLMLATAHMLKLAMCALPPRLSGPYKYWKRQSRRTCH
jgi:hypothetical protein